MIILELIMCRSVKESTAFSKKIVSYVDKINHTRFAPPPQWEKYSQTLDPQYTVVLRLSNTKSYSVSGSSSSHS